jgi:hypothetical protein
MSRRTSILLLVVVAGLHWICAGAADERPRYATPEGCFKDFQAAIKANDWQARLNCVTPAMANVEVGRLAYQVERLQVSGRAEKKAAAALLKEHELGDYDITGRVQLEDLPPGEGEERALNRIGVRVQRKAEFIQAAIALIRQAAKNAGKAAAPAHAVNPTSISELQLGKVQVSSDTARGVLRNEKGEELGAVTFRKIDGTWLLSLSDSEPKVPSFTREQEAALEKLGEKWELEVGDQDEEFELVGLAPNDLNASDEDLAPIAQFTTLKRVDLTGTPVTDKGLAYLKDHQALEVIDISAGFKTVASR